MVALEESKEAKLHNSLSRSTAVAVLSPWQSGKSTTAKMVLKNIPSVYLDLRDSGILHALLDIDYTTHCWPIPSLAHHGNVSESAIRPSASRGWDIHCHCHGPGAFHFSAFGFSPGEYKISGDKNSFIPVTIS